MIGRYNSLFALDSRIFEDGSGSGTGTEIGTKIKTEKILKEWKKSGCGPSGSEPAGFRC